MGDHRVADNLLTTPSLRPRRILIDHVAAHDRAARRGSGGDGAAHDAPETRDYGTAVQILRALGIRRVRLLTNNPHKVAALERLGISVLERCSIEVEPNPFNARFLTTVREKLGANGHLGPLP